MSRNVGRKEKRRASDKVGYSVLHLFKLVNLVTLDPLLGLSKCFHFQIGQSQCTKSLLLIYLVVALTKFCFQLKDYNSKMKENRKEDINL